MSVQDEKIAAESGSTMDVLRYEIKQLKWRVLAIACFLTFGSYYIYDFPGSLGTARTNSIEALFESKHKKYSQGDNLLLYSVYSWPNVVLAFFGGILIDNVLGLRKAMLLFTTLVAIGAAIFYFGVISTNLPVMVFGRFIFGLGGESLSVAQSAFVARWFRGVRGMALAFGITISFSRVGSSFNFDFSPKIAEKWNVQAAVLAGVFACAISLLSCIVLMSVDVYGEKRGIVPPQEIKAVEGVEGSDCVDRAVSWIAALKRDLLKLGAKFWIICAICVTIYCAVFPLIGIAANFFEVKYGVSHNDATTYVSYYQFTCAGASPLIGGLVDRVGRFTLFMILAGSGFTLVHLLFLVAKPTPFAMMMGMGVVYSFLASSLWPAVPYVVEANSVGIAYGIMTAMQNAGLAVYPLASGAILDSFTPPKPFCNTTVADNNCSDVEAPLPHLQGYKDTEAMFMVTAAFGVVLGVVLMIVDRAGNGVLSSSAADRTRILEEEKSLLDTTESESSIVNA